MAPIAVFYTLAKSTPAGNRATFPQLSIPYCSHYTDWAVELSRLLCGTNIEFYSLCNKSHSSQSCLRKIRKEMWKCIEESFELNHRRLLVIIPENIRVRSWAFCASSYICEPPGDFCLSRVRWISQFV